MLVLASRFAGLIFDDHAVFRTGVYFAQLPGMNNPNYLSRRLDPGLSANHTVVGKRTDQVTVYLSDFNYFAGAATVELFTILIVLYTFYGWWRLGRNASLSPLETAKVCNMQRCFDVLHLTNAFQAFDAPLLAQVPSNSSGREIADLEGSRKVRYGALDDETEAEVPSSERQERLVVEDPHNVRKPSGERIGFKEIGEMLTSKLRARRQKREEA